MIDKEITDKINQLLNNGFSFDNHKTKKERDELELDLIDCYGKNGFGAFVEEEMVYVVDSNHTEIMMLEITKNSIYFNPQEHTYLLEAVVVTLEYLTKHLKKEQPSADIFEDDPTEEMPKPKPNFDII